jgi:probable F420-dependent oxidoreductase
VVGICVNLSHMRDWFGGDFTPVMALIARADAIGLDQVSLAEHVLMTEAGAALYPYGKYYQGLTESWPDPIVMLSALAAVTSRIELATGVLIAPLRPAVLLAKQLATLDALSHGRVVAGFGAGWQRAEYEASGIPWDGRFSRMEEQIRACKAIWRDGPASFEGATVSFRDIHCEPKPARPGGVPIWLGIGLTDRNIARIAELADGWLPLETDPARLALDIARLGAACRDRGRDPSGLGIRATLFPSLGPAGHVDYQLTLDKARALTRAGVTVLQVYPGLCCQGPDACIELFNALMTMKAALSADA